MKTRRKSPSFRWLRMGWVSVAAVIGMVACVSTLSSCNLKESLERAGDSTDNEFYMAISRTEKVLPKDDFSKSGFTEAEKKTFEEKYGRYMGTFAGYPMFGKTKVSDDKTERELYGTVVSKLPAHLLRLKGEVEGGMLYRIKSARENKGSTFNELSFRCAYGNLLFKGEPEVRVISIERE